MSSVVDYLRRGRIRAELVSAELITSNQPRRLDSYSPPYRAALGIGPQPNRDTTWYVERYQLTETFSGASPRLQSGDSRSRLLVRVVDRCCRRRGLR